MMSEKEKLMKKYLPQLAQGPDVDSLALRLGKTLIDLETAQANLNILADKIVELGQERDKLDEENKTLAKEIELLKAKTSVLMTQCSQMVKGSKKEVIDAEVVKAENDN